MRGRQNSNALLTPRVVAYRRSREAWCFWHPLSGSTSRVRNDFHRENAPHDGSPIRGSHDRVLRDHGWLCPLLRRAGLHAMDRRTRAMNGDSWIALGCAAALLTYLV